MKLSNQQLENLLLKSFDMLDKTKETCKVTISQCLQSSNQHSINNIIRSCLETMDTTDLCKMLIINRSPNIKPCITFTLKVIKTNIDECKKLENNEFCKDTIKFCSKILNETYNTLKKLHESI